MALLIFHSSCIGYVLSLVRMGFHGTFKLRLKIVLDSSTGENALMLFQSEKPVIYRIKVRDGLVIKGDMCMF